MNKEVLLKLTKQFSLRIIKLVNALPRSPASRVIGNQLLRSGTSVGANYRSACRSRSAAEFVSKIGIVIEEADESIYWMEVIVESKIFKDELIRPLMNEASEIVAIMVASSKTVKTKINQKI